MGMIEKRMGKRMGERMGKEKEMKKEKQKEIEMETMIDLNLALRPVVLFEIAQTDRPSDRLQ